MTAPAYDGYFADPFVARTPTGYVAVGTGSASDGFVFESLTSDDLRSWTSNGTVLKPVDRDLGDTYWAPELVEHDGTWYLYYSVGHDIIGHHIRVASSPRPTGPFADLGVNLTPHERFAIDPHPFRDRDGEWYLYFARDVLDDARPGTHLAVDRLEGMTALAGRATAVLSPNDDWQLYAKDRAMYDDVYDWHTLEGPTVIERDGTYWLTYSGGSWEGAGYGVSWARAAHPLGPWEHAPVGAARVLESNDELIGPGHSSLTVSPDGDDVIVFHAWNTSLTKRQLRLARIAFEPDGPRVLGPL